MLELLDVNPRGKQIKVFKGTQPNSWLISRFGEVVGREFTALDSWAQVHAAEPQDEEDCHPVCLGATAFD